MNEADVPIRPAATVILARDAPRLEVLMVRRHAGLAFGADAWVFPGGKVCAADGAPGGAFENAARMAAARETFEETGLVLARRADGSIAGAAEAERLSAFRAEVEAEPGRFIHRLREQGLEPALDELVPFAHWITPAFEKRRFDTRFFIARAPEGQVALHDGREAVDHVWMAPADLLAMRARGQARLMFPTRLNLEVLAQADSVDAAAAAARARKVMTVLPEVGMRDGVRVLRIPAEAGYSVVEETMDRVMG